MSWWHAKINEDDTIAVAQSFCSPATLSQVYPFIREKKPALAKVFLERINGKHPELLQTVYQSLLNLKTVDSVKLPDKDNDVSIENDNVSYVTSQSTDISEDEGSGDFDDELSGDYNSEDEKRYYEEESCNSDADEDRGKADQPRRPTVNRKVLLEEEILSTSDESDSSSESYSDDDNAEFEEDSRESESSMFSEVRKEPASEISPFRTTSECGVKRRATVISSKVTAYHS